MYVSKTYKLRKSYLKLKNLAKVLIMKIKLSIMNFFRKRREQKTLSKPVGSVRISAMTLCP